jgi:hypothetical protein
MYVHKIICIVILTSHRRKQDKKITDDTSVKHVLVLALPSLCNEHLNILYNNQLVTLNDIRSDDAEEEQNQQKV